MKPCLEPGCPGLAPRGESRCPDHAKGPWADRPSFKARYGVSLSKWKRLRARAIRRDGGRCLKCFSTKRLEVDHILPVAQGGTNDLDNLQTLCASCHHRKTVHDRRG